MVASIIEKTLMEVGILTYTQVSETLAKHNLTFADCYKKPGVLNLALKELQNDTRRIIVNKIRKELHEFDNNQRLVKFMQAISE
ncbi:MAG: hypothetical protein KGH89_08785 [Thaumarchaeota archaeon]|nr:hypothetical protein [Nitrososphaerota archaeon]